MRKRLNAVGEKILNAASFLRGSRFNGCIRFTAFIGSRPGGDLNFDGKIKY